METFVSFLGGFEALLSWEVLGFMIAGFLIGTFFGAMPGLTSVLAIALLLPITYTIDVVPALVMCASIFMAGMYSGSITATTINIPGAPSSMMTAVEGNALMLKGQGANALGHAALGSMIGGAIGALLLMAFMPIAGELALLIRTPGKFSLVLFALVVIILVDKGAIAKGIVATTLGIMLATVGIDVLQPIPRFEFGTELLVEGIGLMPVVIGAFAVSELLVQAQNWNLSLEGSLNRAKGLKIRRRDFIPPWSEIREVGFFTYIKSAFIGYAIGILPGAGGSMAAFVAYADAKRGSQKPEEYGNGSREGIAAAESANNSMCGGAFVPMLMFGIPGDPTTAIVLGVLVINGLQPGPRLIEQQADLIAPMFASLFVSALILIPLTLFLFGPYFIRIVSISRGLLYSAIAVVALVGSYVATYSVFQMFLALVFGVLAFFLRKHNYSVVAMLLGFILGPDLEQYLRRSLSFNDGNPIVFLTSLDSLAFLALTVVFAYLILRKKPKLDAIP
ncbi:MULTISPECIES: tripartite tricarboxylate transporter permease [Halomonadaceae]|jgi:putative tricarboxylic transport membrane protein|uniref:tripartite tricarboxylate transporter permease n=1 Tax=Halomonadaceae TaxID=28256 RepID=UPI00114390D9|nr:MULTISPECIES: tripartite tricarboxylate transporter permease [Halomonas]MCD1588865.1 tripartite tricarboxylate transporter permease [Halomonas sp. IOP_14]CAD5273404.1 Tricarboxylate transporter [Halomonas sp. 156]CAD5278014.1 Tricarboxylate transporter [Halomonas sp. 113]CAD5279408.1 Tricarboxylate transporter [Halomonas sp. 59]CAD5285311.1 Tricarboxylate transport membrane protein TctA [Halomonas sp. I3]